MKFFKKKPHHSGGCGCSFFQPSSPANAFFLPAFIAPRAWAETRIKEKSANKCFSSRDYIFLPLYPLCIFKKANKAVGGCMHRIYINSISAQYHWVVLKEEYHQAAARARDPLSRPEYNAHPRFSATAPVMCKIWIRARARIIQWHLLKTIITTCHSALWCLFGARAALVEKIQVPRTRSTQYNSQLFQPVLSPKAANVIRPMSQF